MNIAAVLAMLLQIGACGHSEFQKPDGTVLQVVVCPVERQAVPNDGTDNQNAGPLKKGQEDN